MTRMKDSGIEWIGEVPEDWGIKPIKHIFAAIGSGTTPDSSKVEYYDGNINWLQSGDLYKKDYVYAVSKTITDLGYRSSASLRIYQAPFLAIAMYGASIGNLAISKIDACVNQAVAVLKGEENIVRFAKLALEISKTELIFAAQGGTQPNINQVLIKNWVIPFPSEIEIKKIADFLDKKVAQLDKIKSLLEEQIKTLEDYRKSLIYETVTKGLDKTVPLKDSGVDWIGQIPEGWGVKPIKYCSRFQRGFGFPVELQGNDDGEIPFYKVSDLRGNSDEISISKNYVDLQTAKQNAWVIVPSGAIIAPVIGAALLNNNRKISTVPFISDNNTLAIIPNNKNKYFYYLFKVIDMNWFNNSSTIPAVNISKLANQIVPTPKEEEQKQIADFLEVQIIKIDKLIEIKQKQINNINQQRQTLIYDVVTGKRRV
jgi:type I restriction enzyme S subunit